MGLAGEGRELKPPHQTLHSHSHTHLPAGSVTFRNSLTVTCLPPWLAFIEAGDNLEVSRGRGQSELQEDDLGPPASLGYLRIDSLG